MSNLIYLSVAGEKQSLISSGCSSLDSIGNKYQSAHENEIFAYELVNNINRTENVSLFPVEIRKPIDNSDSFICSSIYDNQKWSVFFHFIERLSRVGINCILR